MGDVYDFKLIEYIEFPFYIMKGPSKKMESWLTQNSGFHCEFKITEFCGHY